MKQKIRQAFNKAALTYDLHAQVQKKSGYKLITLLPKCISIPTNIIDLGCGSGFITAKLAQAICFKHFYAIDIAEQLLLQAKARLAAFTIQLHEADFQNFRFRGQLFDLAFANMALQWSYDLKNTLLHIHKNLTSQGLIAFSLPLLGTFAELRFCAKNNFYHQDTVTQLLVSVGFSAIACITEVYAEEYDSIITALKAIKAVGANHVINKPKNSLYGKSHLSQLASLSPNKFTLNYNIGFFLARKQ